MRPWYRNSTLQMDDPEMEWLQRQHPATCALWEWLKGDCQKRGSGDIRELSDIERELVSARLGIDAQAFSQISQNLRRVGWIDPENRIRGWTKWQASRTEEEDASRQREKYWRTKCEEAQRKLLASSQITANPPPVAAASDASPSPVSQNLPESPPEEMRGEETRVDLCTRTNAGAREQADAPASGRCWQLFQRVLAVYPKKSGSAAEAERAWLKIFEASPSPEVVVEAIAANLRDHDEAGDWSGDQERFMPYLENYLHKKLWMEKPRGPHANKRSSSSGRLTAPVQSYSGVAKAPAPG